MDLKSYTKEKITLHPVHCLISMLQITNLYDNIKAMIGFSDVQELVSFFKIFALRKGHLRETKKRCSRSNTILR